MATSGRSRGAKGPPPFWSLVVTLLAVVAVVVVIRLSTGGGVSRASGVRLKDVVGSVSPIPSQSGRAIAPSPDAGPDQEVDAAGVAVSAPIDPDHPGLLTFRGNLTRSYYGRGPVPKNPTVLWRYPKAGALCSRSRDRGKTSTWCGTGWTGQPNVLPGKNGSVEVRIGAYDGNYHFLDGETGRELVKPLRTGDLAKGSATSDPDGFPLYYAGSRDNRLRIVATDRSRPRVLWSVNARRSVPNGGLWNDDWDGAPLVVGDFLLAGSENSYLYVIELRRGYDERGRVTVDPRIAATIPGWDERLLADVGDKNVSIESSVAFRDGVAYFANSGGLVQGWDISDLLDGGDRYRRVFRFWTGDDTDASVVIDEDGMLYVASELQRSSSRARRVGQLMKLDPTKSGSDALLWSVPVTETSGDGPGGIWATPAVYGDMVYVSTNDGDLLGVDRVRGQVRWRVHLSGPVWSSPVPVDGVLLQGDCAGVLHAYDIATRPGRRPRRLWKLEIDGGCIESTPAVWDGMIYVGTRSGGIYGIGDRRPT